MKARQTQIGGKFPNLVDAYGLFVFGWLNPTQIGVFKPFKRVLWQRVIRAHL